LRTERGAGMRARAAIRARDLLERTMTLPDPVALQDGGDFGDGYRWERKVREARELLEDDDNQHALDVKSDITLFEIEVSVLWPQSGDREGVYTVRTLRVAPSPPT